MQPLPVDAILSDLHTALQQHRNAVLQAPPGAGKTTRVPLSLLNARWLEPQRIVMLEPRRLAARAAAHYMARQLAESVGETVGYRVRLDTRVGPRTRIEVVTEGVLTRMLQSDPALDGVGIVIFDEFHERSLHADLGLALTLQSRLHFRPDLAVLVMSATLQGERIAALLGDAPIVTSAGRLYDVVTNYVADASRQQARGHVGFGIEGKVVRAVLRSLAEDEGDVLVFLPGAAEIQRTHAQLREIALPSGTDLYPLFGNLSNEEQDRAIAPSPPGRRKVVLATSIAETSLTIEGVRIVVDSGLMRVPRFSARTGMTRLETVRVTRSSADQRRGRAGRTAPGTCYRLWSEAEQGALLAHGEPEITQADLAPLALELAAWGVTDVRDLSWLDAPPPGAYAQARELLHELGAISGDSLSEHGRRMADLPLHPRLAHMVLRGLALGQGGLAADLAALLSERDVLVGVSDPDLDLRLNALRSPKHKSDRGALNRVRQEAREIRRRLNVREPAGSFDSAGLLLAFAYPDRIARRRADKRDRFLLRGGRGASVEGGSALAASEFIVAAQVDDRGAETRVFLGAALGEQDVWDHFADQFSTTRELEWGPASDVLRATERVQLGAITISERSFQPEPAERASAWLATVQRLGLQVLNWSDAARGLRLRIGFLHALDGSWPDVSDAALLASLDVWLQPQLHEQRSLAGIDLLPGLEQLLDWTQRRRLDELAPTHMVVPSGSRIPVDYSDPGAPSIAVRLQEVFGWLETPRLGGGRVPLVLQLLSPAQRPVQVTRDLASFWRSGYFEVKKDLKGRYPRHYWPDDPFTATATRRVRPRTE